MWHASGRRDPQFEEIKTDFEIYNKPNIEWSAISSTPGAQVYLGQGRDGGGLTLAPGPARSEICTIHNYGASCLSQLRHDTICSTSVSR